MFDGHLPGASEYSSERYDPRGGRYQLEGQVRVKSFGGGVHVSELDL